MIITVECPHCERTFPVDPAKVPAGGVKVRCSNCSGIFRVEKPQETPPPEAAPAPVPTSPPESAAPAPAPTSPQESAAPAEHEETGPATAFEETEETAAAAGTGDAAGNVDAEVTDPGHRPEVEESAPELPDEAPFSGETHASGDPGAAAVSDEPEEPEVGGWDSGSSWDAVEEAVDDDPVDTDVDTSPSAESPELEADFMDEARAEEEDAAPDFGGPAVDEPTPASGWEVSGDDEVDLTWSPEPTPSGGERDEPVWESDPESAADDAGIEADDDGGSDDGVEVEMGWGSDFGAATDTEPEMPAEAEPEPEEWVFETEDDLDPSSLEVERLDTVEEQMRSASEERYEAEEGVGPAIAGPEVPPSPAPPDDDGYVPAAEAPIDTPVDRTPSDPDPSFDEEFGIEGGDGALAQEATPEGAQSSDAAEGAAPSTEEPVAPAAPQGFQFGRRDPKDKAKRLARVLVSDIITYNPERHARALENRTLPQDFEDEIQKSWAEYVDQVGREIAESTPFFTQALNDILARGEQVFTDD